jgi:predicted ATPase
MHPGGMTALVGREEELELLLRRWTRARTGEGQVVLLSGEAGIGKSRLHSLEARTPRVLPGEWFSDKKDTEKQD